MKTKTSTLLSVVGLCLLAASAFADSTPVLQGDTTHPYKFLVISSTDHITGLTGQATALLAALHERKNAAATSVPTGTLTEEDSTNMPGWYDYTPSALDVNTLGSASFHTAVTGSDPVDFSFNVVAVNSYDASLFGLTGIGTLAGQNTITGKTNLIATNAADSPNTVTAQSTTTSTSTAVAALPAANATAVWGSTTRALTDKANFALVSTEYANIAAVTSTYGFDGPPAGTILTLTITRNSSSQPVLTWTADPAATLYKVYRSTDGANYTVIATPATGTLTYTDTARPAGATVYYHITSTH